jgi:hypothetical protein
MWRPTAIAVVLGACSPPAPAFVSSTFSSDIAGFAQRRQTWRRCRGWSRSRASTGDVDVEMEMNVQVMGGFASPAGEVDVMRMDVQGRSHLDVEGRGRA